MANERVNEDEAEAILSNLKMEGRRSDCWIHQRIRFARFKSLGFRVDLSSCGLRKWSGKPWQSGKYGKH